MIELKHGGNAKGIYWGPLQLLAYRDVFRDKLNDITDGLKNLIQQKVELGLLPREAQDRLPHGNFPGLKAVLAVGNPKARSRCWGKMEQVGKQLDVSMQIEDSGELRLIRLK